MRCPILFVFVSRTYIFRSRSSITVSDLMRFSVKRESKTLEESAKTVRFQVETLFRLQMQRRSLGSEQPSLLQTVAFLPRTQRHTSASLLLALGVDTKLISTRLGHSSVAFTMDTYAHLLPEANNQAAVKLARILSGNPESFNRTIEIKSGAAG